MIAYYAIGDLIPLYPVYALLFSDHGLSAGAISSLFTLWSLTAFVLEVPSGAWADVVSRRGLLAVSSLLLALGFATWIVFPSYAGFALGFVLWGASGALMSGTFQALLYDELSAFGAAAGYPRIMGFANSGSMLANLVATALAAPLMSVGGYALVGWLSVAVALVQLALALSLPRAPRVAEADETEVASPEGGLVRRYFSMLRDGLRESGATPTIRHAVLISALLYSFLVYDEYFPLVARENGAPATQVPLLIALTVAGQALGTVTAGRTAKLGGRVLALALSVAAAVLAAGALTGDVGGFVAIALGYGALNNVMIVSEARLQESITGAARATVTSVSGLLSEVFALLLFASFAIGSGFAQVKTIVALLTIPLLVVAFLVARWLPRPLPQKRDPSSLRQSR
ncbi:MAG: MFS transporter [Actinomycetota bacterium]|nr:MFS transporter [Actinomycetota bacterium]